jgi:ribosomal protein S18 acetylase RimI-like enzyme
MATKIFGDKKITTRKINEVDLKNVKKFQVFINSLIEEDAMVSMNKRLTSKEESAFLERILKEQKNKTRVYLIAESDGEVVGSTGIGLSTWRRNHIGDFGIVIKNGYRGVGLGERLMSEIIKLAKKELNPKPRIIQLQVVCKNKPAFGLYKKMGFKTVAKLPKQLQYRGKLVSTFVMMREV